MQVIRECAGLYTVHANGLQWSITDTNNHSDRGAWRWCVACLDRNDGYYHTGTFKEAKEIVAKYSPQGE